MIENNSKELKLRSMFTEKHIHILKLKSISYENEIYLYKYFKQATKGNNNTPKPCFLYFKNKKKWNAWNEVKGTSKTDAMEKYINKVNELLGL